MLILSQVILSLQLGFAVVPLVMFTSNKAKMGRFANGTVIKVVSWATAAIIVCLNVYLLYQTVAGWLS